MGKGGVQPQPDLKLLTRPGTKPKDRSRANRGRGSAQAVVPDTNPLGGAIPECPSDIKVGTEGRTYWRLYWKKAGSWLVEADIPVVTRLCRLHNVAAALMAGIESEALYRVSSDKEGARSTAHPMLRDYDMVAGRIERLEDRLGLNPVERSRIRIQVKEKESPLDRWAGSRSKAPAAQP